MIDYQDARPRWERQEDLIQPVDDNFAVVLPDGNVLVFGGEDPDHTPIYNLVFEMFNPKSGKVKSMVRSAVPRADHTSAVLLPDATVLVMGGDRTDRIPPDLIPGAPRDRDAGVPVAEIYKPPYLFRGARPVITAAPSAIAYGSAFPVSVSGGGEVGSVVLIRPSPQTHKWDWENRYVKLAFDHGDNGTVTVKAPAFPGLAVPGYYMLFVLNERGVPSEAALVHLAL
jgi:hypothetical protein